MDIDTHLISGDEHITELNKTVGPATPSSNEAEKIDRQKSERKDLPLGTTCQAYLTSWNQN